MMLAKLYLLSQQFSKKILDTYLIQDPDYYQDLIPLAGKEILFFVRDWHLLIALKFTRTQVELSYCKADALPKLQDEMHLSMQGRSFDLFAFALYQAKRSRLLSENLISYQGDLFLLEALVKLFKERNFLDNVPLPKLLKTLILNHFSRAAAWQKQNIETFKNTIIDYLQEELSLLPSYKHFVLLQDVQLELDEQLDRLEAHTNSTLKCD